jgi:hypothetical protein
LNALTQASDKEEREEHVGLENAAVLGAQKHRREHCISVVAPKQNFMVNLEPNFCKNNTIIFSNRGPCLPASSIKMLPSG